VKALTDMAAKATEVLTNISAKKTRDASTEDREWVLCKFLYHKLKKIPHGDLKDDLQLEIHNLLFIHIIIVIIIIIICLRAKELSDRD